MTLEIIIAGRGGQGILLTGYLLGKALVKKGFYVVNSEMYSAETRGGFSRSDLIVFPSEAEMDIIKVRRADIAIFMYKDQMYSYADYVKPDAQLVVLDATFIGEPARPWPRILKVPFTRLAEEKVGTYRVANVFMLGVFSYVTELVDPETMKEIIKTSVRPKWVEINLKAFDAGYSYAEENLEKIGVKL